MLDTVDLEIGICQPHHEASTSHQDTHLLTSKERWNPE